MKEQIKAPEKIQLSDEEIANLSDTEFKTLVIRMLTKVVEYGRKIKEKVKTMKSEMRKMYREPTVREGNQDSNQWFGVQARNKYSTRTD